MPKLKTRRATAKRFHITGRGKVRRARAFRSHLLSHRKQDRKRRLRHNTVMAKADEERIKRLLPYA